MTEPLPTSTFEDEDRCSAVGEVPVPQPHNDDNIDSMETEKRTLPCSKCLKRMARDGCTQSACLQCCEDLQGCETHKKPRAQAQWKEQVLAGTSLVQQLATAKRKMKMGKFFREPGFMYMGDTVVIWDLRAYARNEKWRDDAIRKAIRRQKIQQDVGKTPNDRPMTAPRNSRKRFHRIVDERYLAIAATVVNADAEKV